MIHESVRRNPETYQKINVTTLEVILSVAADPFDGGLDGLDRGLGLLSRIA